MLRRTDGRASFSVKEAVRIAQSNNLMGLVCTSRLLVSLYLEPEFMHLLTSSTQKMVPALIESIKVAGLVLVSDISADSDYAGTRGQEQYRAPEGVDGILRGNGMLRFNETIDM